MTAVVLMLITFILPQVLAWQVNAHSVILYTSKLPLAWNAKYLMM